MATFCHTLLNLLEEKFECQAAFNNLEWRLIQHRPVDIAEDDVENIEGSPLEELEQEAEGKKAEIQKLETQISELIEKILRTPLCLIPIPHSHRPVLQRLKQARSRLEELEGANSESSNLDLIDVASDEVERAMELLKLDTGAQLADRALTWLFLASVYEKQKDYEGAQKWAQKAYEYFSDGDEPQRLVTRLIQGNIYSANVAQKKFEGRNAYGDALWRLERLVETEAGQGNQQRAELYRLLKERLEVEVEQLRTWRTV